MPVLASAQLAFFGAAVINIQRCLLENSTKIGKGNEASSGETNDEKP